MGWIKEETFVVCWINVFPVAKEWSGLVSSWEIVNSPSLATAG